MPIWSGMSLRLYVLLGTNVFISRVGWDHRSRVFSSPITERVRFGVPEQREAELGKERGSPADDRAALPGKLCCGQLE